LICELCVVIQTWSAVLFLDIVLSRSVTFSRFALAIRVLFLFTSVHNIIAVLKKNKRQ